MNKATINEEFFRGTCEKVKFDAKGMRLDDTVELMVNRQRYLPVFAKFWDIGLNTYDKLSQAIDIMAEHKTAPEIATEKLNALIDQTPADLPYNPYMRLMDQECNGRAMYGETHERR